MPSSANSADVERALVGGVEADDGVADLAVHVGDRVGDALAAEALAAVAQLDGLVRAGAGAARDGGPAPGAGHQLDLDLDGRVAAGIEDLPAGDVVNDAHENSWGQCCECIRSRARSGSERTFGAPAEAPVVEDSSKDSPERIPIPSRGILGRIPERIRRRCQPGGGESTGRAGRAGPGLRAGPAARPRRSTGTRRAARPGSGR